MNAGLQHGERSMVEVDGDEIEVWDHVSVSKHYYINSVNGHETFEPEVFEGDMGGHGPQPSAVTMRVAATLDDIGVDVDQLGIRVVDMSREDVQEL